MITNTGNMPTPPDGAECAECGQGLWHYKSRERGTCARCHREAQR